MNETITVVVNDPGDEQIEKHIIMTLPHKVTVW